MISAFKNGDDIHAITASQIFGIPVSMVTSEMRFRSKAVNFGILYGMGAFSLAQDLKISRYEAQNYINRYLEHYSGVDEYMKNIIDRLRIYTYNIIKHLKNGGKHMAKEQETKREKFVRLAEARTNKIIDMLQLLSNCSNSSAYDYTQQDVDKIFAAIESEVREAKKKFNKIESKKSSRFTLD